MVALKAAAFAFGMALASGAWAACPEGFKELDVLCEPPAPKTGDLLLVGPSTTAHAVTLPAGVQLSAGKIDLSSDQKLARAYAICMISEALSASASFANSCVEIMGEWHAHAVDNADRAFIEEVARSLSK